MIRILWDEPKRLKNIATHKLDFANLDLEFFSAATIRQAKNSRLMAIGQMHDGTIAVVFVRLGTEGLSVISMRRASRQERKLHGTD